MFSLLSSTVVVLPSSPRLSCITPANGAPEDKCILLSAFATRGGLRGGARIRARTRARRVDCRPCRTAGKALADAQEEDVACYTRKGDEAADLSGHASKGYSSPASSGSWTVRLMGSSLAVAFTLAQAVMPISTGTSPNGFSGVPAAEAVLFSPDTKVPRTAEVALRRAIPAVNLSVKKIQDSLEEIFYLLRIPQRKPFGTMENNVKRALQLAKDDKSAILNVLPPDKKEVGLEMYNDVIQGKYGMERLLDAIVDKDPDKISIRLSNALEKLADLEILEAPGLAFLLPSQYQEYPRLTGRATVAFVLEKGDGSPFTVAAGGGPQKTAVLEVVLDGYSAPLTSGNFAELVMQGKYNGLTLRSGQQSVLSDNQVDEIGRPIPLEILPAGEFQPLYRTTLDVQDGEIPVLPLSVYGSVAMAHNEVAQDFSSPNQFFFYLYDKRNAGLGGLAFDEGQFSVFGYVTKGRELLSQLKTGDVIQSATMISGQEKLVLPTISSS